MFSVFINGIQVITEHRGHVSMASLRTSSLREFDARRNCDVVSTTGTVHTFLHDVHHDATAPHLNM